VTVADPNTTTRARTARRPHLCDSCHWTPSLRGVATIQPGHRYLLHTAFPDGMVNTSDRPYSLKECVACTCERDDSAGLLVAFDPGERNDLRDDEEPDEHECLSCGGRHWFPVQGFNDERVAVLRVPCGCAENLLVEAS
jgi:hypothetical protein